MKFFLVVVVVVVTFSATATTADSATRECCLCGDECGPVAAEKVDLFTVSPFANFPEQNGAGGATCEEIAMGLLEHSEDSVMCADVRRDLQEACCTDHFGTPAFTTLPDCWIGGTERFSHSHLFSLVLYHTTVLSKMKLTRM